MVDAGVVRSGRFNIYGDLSEARGAILSLLTERESRAFMGVNGQRLVDIRSAIAEMIQIAP